MRESISWQGTAKGGLWAIQAKAYAESYAIRKADVDSFL